VTVGGEVPSIHLDEARAAFERGEFDVARRGFEAAVGERVGAEVGAEALDGLGQALWFLCDIDAGIARREEAFAAFRRAGRAGRAAEIALWLAVEQATSLGNSAAADGWFRRAERLLDDAPLCRAHAELEVHRGQRCADPGEAAGHFQKAVDVGKELDDPDCEVRGLNSLGFLKVMLGETEAGIALLDETMAAAMAGELRDPWAIGATCCSMLFACDRIADLKRAAEWCRVVIQFTEQRRYVPLSALCRSVYAGVLIASGDWTKAETELQSALATYRGFGRPLAAYPLARLAGLRLRQGRVEEAAELVAGWEGHPEMGTLVVALMLERGDTESAGARLRRQLDRLGVDSPMATALLPLLVRLHLDQGDGEAAENAADQLARLARRLGHEHLLASSRLAQADVAAFLGEESAASAFESVAQEFARLRMPFEEAQARLALARLLSGSEPMVSIAEAEAACASFERLGAAREADRAAELLRSLGATGRRHSKGSGLLTVREREVLMLVERGLSNREIAGRLFIAPKTASHHVSTILAKLGVRTRAEAAAFAARERAEGSPSR
jgi:DNA-binding CsgD family transcriptional regulator